MTYLRGYTEEQLLTISQNAYTAECVEKGHTQVESDITKYAYGIITHPTTSAVALAVEDTTYLDSQYVPSLESSETFDSEGWFEVPEEA